jgi:apolipoprotein D and lipocalin family protein
MKYSLEAFGFLCVSLALCSCATIPKGGMAVVGLEKARYLGKWYEIARYDFAFEKDLKNTTAEYSANADGTIAVKNRGFNYKKNKWEEALGKARFRGAEARGELEVSFFGPFYAAYNIIALDKEYRYALVAGKNLKYLWILSRTRTIPDEVKKSYLDLAASLGYDLSALVWVEQDEGKPD